MFDYSPLWKTLLQAVIDNKTLDRLKKGQNITMLTLERLCNILNCTPNDIVQFQ